jgi:hypothetical protein
MVIHTQGPARTEYVTREVREHRAPTDDSVKLLADFEKAARDKIVDAVKVGDTVFECVVHIMIDAASGGDRLFKVIFSLNGKKMTVDYRHAAHALIDNKLGWVDPLRDAVAREIAVHILHEELLQQAIRGTRIGNL